MTLYIIAVVTIALAVVGLIVAIRERPHDRAPTPTHQVPLSAAHWRPDEISQ